MELLKVICPACGKQITAVVRDGRVRGYCATAQQYVDFSVEARKDKKNYRQDPEYRDKLRAATKRMWQDPKYRAKQKAALRNKGAGTNTS